MRAVVTLLLVIVLSDGFCQSHHEIFLTRKQAEEDLQLLKSGLYEIHPSTFRYTTKSAFDAAFEQAMSKLDDSVSLFEFTRLVVPLIAKVHCGHTFPMLPQYNASLRAVPLDVMIVDNRIFVTENLSGYNEPHRGSEIMSINGESSHLVLEYLRSFESADGYAQRTKDRKIERFFKWYYAVYYPSCDTFKLSVRSMDGAKHLDIDLPSQTDEQIEQRRVKADPIKPLAFRIDAERKIAILRISSFMVKQIKKHHGQNFKKIIGTSFAEMKKKGIDKLVIDLRGNTGGMAFVPPMLYSFITKDDFQFKDKLLFKHGYKFSHPETLNRSKVSDWINRRLSKKINDSTYAWTLHNNTKRYKGKRDAFTGKVFVLVDGMTSSGASELAIIIHYKKRGLLIGENSGGDYNGINGYDRTYLQLPNARIGVLIAGFRSVMPWNSTEYFGHGAPVDYHVRPTIDDELAGRDVVLDFVYSLLEAP